MMNDIIYALDDVSSIGSESAFGEDIPSDVSVGSEASSLGPLDTTIDTHEISQQSVDVEYDCELDCLSDYYESDLENEFEEEEDDNSVSHHYETSDDDLSFVSDDFDLSVSFSDDDDGLSVISESSRFERSLRMQLAAGERLRKDESPCPYDSALEVSLRTERLCSQASKIIKHGINVKTRGVSKICSLDRSLRLPLHKTLFQIPSRSVSLGACVRL